MKFNPLVILILFVSEELIAQTDSTRSYSTTHVQGEPPKIDGLLNDAAWAQVEWGGDGFRQRFPDKGAPASVNTRFKILYDDKNLYVGIRCFDPEPSKIVRRMSRRDGFDGDFVEINIDSYYDKRTAFSFTASVSGVKGDEYVSNNGDNWDASWDPIWYLKTSIDKEGWVAEFRIPLSQLRFADKPEHTWGIQILRNFFRKQESSNWQYIPPDASGFVHLFGQLTGIKGIRPQKQLEIQPYVVAKTERFEKEEGNPFATGTSSATEVGIDAKIGITSDITLDLTVNPDFGQVEADPSQVNLTAFEVYFQERRPFFIEGNNTLNFPITDFNRNNLFYSRRIGRPPQVDVDTDASGPDNVNEFVKADKRSTILGAAKLTGKNKHGFSWGLLESVTSLERATIDSLGFKRYQSVEPMTNYLVARAQKDIHKGNTIVGGMFTATNRKLDDPILFGLHRNAYSGGVDFIHNWKDRKYYVSAKSAFSFVNGEPEALVNTQLSSERYFQRPDNNHATFNPNRKSLAGTGGTLIFGKKSGNLIFDVGGTYLSPGFEMNDVGFLLQTDIITQWTWTTYRVLNPKWIFRTQRYYFIQFLEWDFDGKNISNGYNAEGYGEFKNLWSYNAGFNYNAFSVSNADLRGGPALRYPRSFNYYLWLGTDRRKKFFAAINPSAQWGGNNSQKNTSLDFQFVYRPMNALTLSVAPSFSHNLNQMQYVATTESSSGPRYIVGEIDQSTVRVTLRATYMITPNISIQYYGQPFGTTGRYSNYKLITDASAAQYNQRFNPMTSPYLSYVNDQYNFDENHDGISDYYFNKPDFSFGQYRSNTVLRWEYIPGSTLFLVWTKERNGGFVDQSSGPIHERYKLDFNEKGHNIFLVKFTYRLVL
jgi:hypothetical protein